MAIEIERKFLVKYVPDEAYVYGSLKQKIAQGYLMLDLDQQLRVRIIDGNEAFIAYKKDVSSGIKHEFEYEIPVADAIVLFDQCKYRLHKTRYTFKHAGLEIQLDEYTDGLLIAEIEFKNINSFLEFEKRLETLPGYIEKEVTGLSEYSNVQLAMKNF